MRFESTQMFVLFWFVGFLVLFLWRMYSRHKSIMRQFVKGKLLDEVAFNYSKRNKIIKIVLILFVFIFSILALCRPQWGFEWQEVKRKGIDVMVVIDTSKSMLTQDVKPNRLERTKLAVKDLLKKLKGDRIGLIAFAGEAFLMCPLTVDYSGFLLSLNDIGIDSVPRGGTNLERAIRVGLDSFEDVESQYKTIVIITDGDNLEGRPMDLAKKAKNDGVKIYTIGIGTKEGELIQTSDEGSNLKFLKDSEGNFVKSRLNEGILQKIALVTKGAYIKASGAEFGLDIIYERDLANLEKRDLESKMQKKYFDRFQLPLAVALIFLLGESCLSTRKKSTV